MVVVLRSLVVTYHDLLGRKVACRWLSSAQIQEEYLLP